MTPEPIRSVADEGYRSGVRRARLVQVLLALWVVLAAVAAAASLVEFRIVSRLMDNPLSVSLSDVMASDDRQVTIAVIWLMGVLVTGIAFIVWMLRIYDNAKSLGGVTPRYSRGWVIGGGLVPFLNLWRPKEIMDDLWVASDPDPSKSGRVSRASLRLVHVWWALWILGAFVGGFFGWNREADLADLRNYAVFDVVTDLVLAAGAIAALLVVDRLTRRQEMRAGLRFVDYQPNVTTTSGSTSAVAAVLGVVGLATLVGTFLAFTTTTDAPRVETTEVSRAETVEEFFADFVVDIRTGNSSYLVQRIHPQLIEIYGKDQCRKTFVDLPQDPTFDIRIEEITGPANWSTRLDGIDFNFSDVYMIHVEVTGSPGAAREDIHLGMVGGRMYWFADCGDPLVTE